MSAVFQLVSVISALVVFVLSVACLNRITVRTAVAIVAANLLLAVGSFGILVQPLFAREGMVLEKDPLQILLVSGIAVALMFDRRRRRITRRRPAQ